MNYAFRLGVALVMLSVCAVAGTRAATAARHVTVVDLMTFSATIEFYEAGSTPVAAGTVEAKRDRVFDVLPFNGATYLVVRSTACITGKRYQVPAKPTDIRLVINAGCAFSVQ